LSDGGGGRLRKAEKNVLPPESLHVRVVLLDLERSVAGVERVHISACRVLHVVRMILFARNVQMADKLCFGPLLVGRTLFLVREPCIARQLRHFWQEFMNEKVELNRFPSHLLPVLRTHKRPISNFLSLLQVWLDFLKVPDPLGHFDYLIVIHVVELEQVIENSI